MAKMGVLVVVGSESDLSKARGTADVLRELGVPVELRVASAHRSPKTALELARTARDRGMGVIVAMAGLAAHLPGVMAAHTTLPVIGVPVASGTLGGLDALLSIVQMPPGVPVATVGIDAAKNAALLAARILALGDPVLAARVDERRKEMTAAVDAADARARGSTTA